jgi:hypothetical protein
MSVKLIRQCAGGVRALSAALLLALGAGPALGQGADVKSIGGKEHEDNILGVKLGMDVQTALEAVFVNAHRKPGQEKPDAMRQEGKDKKDIRVLYNDLSVGKLQIVFAEGKWVKEIVLLYAVQPRVSDLRLPSTSFIGEAFRGERFDDRYTIGYTGSDKRERFWWRDDKTPAGYRARVGFISAKSSAAGGIEQSTIARKIISVTPGDEDKFLQALSAQ